MTTLVSTVSAGDSAICRCYFVTVNLDVLTSNKTTAHQLEALSSRGYPTSVPPYCVPFLRDVIGGALRGSPVSIIVHMRVTLMRLLLHELSIWFHKHNFCGFVESPTRYRSCRRSISIIVLQPLESINQIPGDGDGDGWIFYDPWPLDSDASRSRSEARLAPCGNFTAADVSFGSTFDCQPHQP